MKALRIRPALPTLPALPALLILGCCAAAAQPSSMPANRNVMLSFDMPYGACRLALRHDGSAHLAYGAAPAFVEVPAGTFNASAVKAEFESRIVVSRQRTQWPEPVGSLSLEGAAGELWFNDVAFAQALFDRALQHRLPAPEPETSGPQTSGPRNVVLRACAQQHRATNPPSPSKPP